MHRSVFLPLALVLGAATAHADPVATHALIVGSNAAGPGQSPLRYAEEDATRVGSLLAELGGFTPSSIEVALHPTPAALRSRLAKLAERVAVDVAAGKQTRVFFYYSGHARASAIDLGAEALPLEELRGKLLAAGATLTVVVLDACQSGAFSRVKGAQPAADFSFNSRQQLDAKGVAVLASSTGSELSQESEQLRSSYFTHHLLVGMRGAGDANGDGQVTVDEAYRYAYHQTLLATSATAVGGQHVTLEVDLKGHGEVALSYPRAASAAIELPGDLEGKALVQLKKARMVVAETQKAKGKPVRIAVAPGDYEVLVRQGDRMLRCPVSAPGAVDVRSCTSERYVDATRKGQTPWRIDWWALDATWMIGGKRSGDAFEARLADFGYTDRGGNGSVGLAARGYVRKSRGLALGAVIALDQLYTPTWSRDTERDPLEFRSSVTMLGGGLSAHLHLTDRLAVTGDLLGSLGLGRSRFADQDGGVTTETYFGWGGAAVAAVQLEQLFGTNFALAATCKLELARVIENDIGDQLDSGGVLCGVGLGYQRENP